METIRTLRKEELKDHFALGQFAFQFEMTQEQIEQSTESEKPERIWGSFVDDRLVAKMTLIPLHTYVQGKPVSMGGIAGVATWPEYRRKGLIGKMLGHLLHIMKERGQLVSFLAPFSFPFYRKYGWEQYVDRKSYTMDVGLLPVFPDTGGRVERSHDWQLLRSLYESYAASFNGTLQRDEDWWTNQVIKHKEGKIAVYVNAVGVPCGYMIYQVKNRELNIDELVFLDEDARAGLWRFIFNHDSMIERVRLIAPANDPLPFLLANPRIKQEISPYFMARIVDVERFLQQYSFKATGQTHVFQLEVADTYAPWNNKRFSVRVNGEGLAEVIADADSEQRVAGVRTDAEAACDIQTLSVMLLSYQRPSLLQSIGRLHGSDSVVAVLEQLIPQKQTYLLDFF